MSTRSKEWPFRQTLYEQSIKHTILVPLMLLFIAVIFKILDVFVLRLDELLGEIILSKSIGFLLVIAYLWVVGKSVTAIGLHGRAAGKALIIGATGVILILLARSMYPQSIITMAETVPKTKRGARATTTTTTAMRRSYPCKTPGKFPGRETDSVAPTRRSGSCRFATAAYIHLALKSIYGPIAIWQIDKTGIPSAVLNSE